MNNQERKYSTEATPEQKQKYDMEVTPERARIIKKRLIMLLADQYGCELTVTVVNPDGSESPAF